MKRLIFIPLLWLTSCTLTFNNASTHGEAEDVGDSTPTTDVKADPNVSVPLSGLPKL